ncbi:cuticle protein 16.8 [Trichonephila clavata]|uniref:Cuticle protein 16.8 n=1 Tax=Trichonephila clavata TaxID=2740835 RepID=A0A8X6LNS6_TRICU|nr:cuticle protein 16.8 [Trichonephila clavata]
MCIVNARTGLYGVIAVEKTLKLAGIETVTVETVAFVLAFAAAAIAQPYGEPYPLESPYPVEDGAYAFGYSVKDKHGEQHREETGDGAGGVKGSYGFKDDRGVSREVVYVADKAGFRPEIKTNEHGTAPHDPAATKLDSSAHPYFGGAGAKHAFRSHVLPVEPAAHAVPYAGISHAGPLHGGLKGYDNRVGIH